MYTLSLVATVNQSVGTTASSWEFNVNEQFLQNTLANPAEW